MGFKGPAEGKVAFSKGGWEFLLSAIILIREGIEVLHSVEFRSLSFLYIVLSLLG